MPTLTQDEVKIWGRARVEKEMRERTDQVQAIRIRNGGSLVGITDDAAIESVKGLHGDMNILGERKDNIAALEAAEQKAANMLNDLDSPDGGGMVHSGTKQRKLDSRDAGQIFATSEAFKRYNGDGQKGVEVEIPIGALLPELRQLDLKGFRSPGMKATLGTNSALSGVGSEWETDDPRTGLMVEERFQSPNIADLIPQGTTENNSVVYMRETINAEGAIETEEAQDGGEADIEASEDSAPVRKIVVWLPVTEEILEDEQMVRGYINNRLPAFVRRREDRQLLAGNGSGQNLQGILGLNGIDESTSYSIGSADAQDKLEKIFSASSRIAENFMSADAVVMRIALWEQIRLAKTDLGYLIAPATESATPRVWGLRVLTNENMPAESNGNAPILVGAFGEASMVWRRRAVTLAVTDSDGTNFKKGILTVKATSRLAVTHLRPAGYATISSTT